MSNTYSHLSIGMVFNEKFTGAFLKFVQSDLSWRIILFCLQWVLFTSSINEFDAGSCKNKNKCVLLSIISGRKIPSENGDF
jgi:hypothetical protein